jgi:hypothetical protein
MKVRQMEQQGRILDGSLETLSLQATLKMLALSGKTGLLIVNSGQEALSIYLNKGQIAGAQEAQGVPMDLLEMFRLLGRLNRQQALDHRRAVGNAPPHIVLQDLVQHGLLAAGEMQQYLQFGVTQSLSRALRWEHGRFEFHRNVLVMESHMKPLDVDTAVLESLRLADEWEDGSPLLSRMTVARWVPTFNGDIRQLGLSREEIQVLCLSNGQIPLQAIAYVLRCGEGRVGHVMQRLLDLGLIEVVDAQLEAELERDLMNLLTASQHQLSQQPNAAPEQRLVILIKALALCANGLLMHHGKYARSLRGRGAVQPAEITRYLEQRFAPLLRHIQGQQAILETVAFRDGQLDYSEILTLHALIRGQQLQAFYWEAVLGFSAFIRAAFTTILVDEVGTNGRVHRQFSELWQAFLHEIDEEIGQHHARRTPYANLPHNGMSAARVLGQVSSQA